jgi:uncharacterized protein YicC (UPF0701 family)
MIKSMTGFASVTREEDGVSISVTLKSVNHRFLDLQLRIPGSMATLENRIRSIVQSRVARGRVEVAVSLQQRREPSVEVELNEGFLEALKPALERARQLGHIQGAVTAGDLLRFPQALAIREKTDQAAAENGPLAEQAARALSDALRLMERVRELRADSLADEALIAQEIARFVGRSDITEEVVRFRGHLEHWQALSNGPEPCGRKLDFLLQEMNREVNTAGSKAEGPAVSELIVSLKADLEKMREQVQNVE